MKKKRLILLMALGVLSTLGILWAADHIDAPAVASTTTDITDFYAFASPANSDNLVFVANTQGLLDPMSTSSARFDKDVLIEFNIDNDGDAVEDFVIQAYFRDGMVRSYGPIQPATVGSISKIETTGTRVEADITAYGAAPVIGTNSDGVKIFAGPRDDPFFMDFARYNEIIAGNATGFNNPGSDTFAGTNVLSVVIEVPKGLLGNSDTINTWVEAKRRI